MWIAYFILLPGLIVGAIIRYASTGSAKTDQLIDLPFNSTFGPGNPPDYLKLAVRVGNSSNIYYQYSYKNQIHENNVYDKELEEKVIYSIYIKIIYLFIKLSLKNKIMKFKPGIYI